MLSLSPFSTRQFGFTGEEPGLELSHYRVYITSLEQIGAILFFPLIRLSHLSLESSGGCPVDHPILSSLPFYDALHLASWITLLTLSRTKKKSRRDGSSTSRAMGRYAFLPFYILTSC